MRGESACQAGPIQLSSRCSFGRAPRLFENGKVPTLAGRNIYNLSTKTYTSLYFLIAISKFTFRKMFASFVKALYMEKFCCNIGFPFKLFKIRRKTCQNYFCKPELLSRGYPKNSVK